MEFLASLVLIFGVSAAVVFLLQRLKVPSLVGFLIAGVIIGPHSVGIVRDTHVVETLAEIGVILLLFTIGIEFSMARLMRMKRAVVGGGGIQVLLTIALSAAAFYYATGDVNRAVFFGFLIALSSTAIVMKILAEKGETDSPHGRMMVGILIFQDLCVVPLMLLTPTLSGGGVALTEVFTKMGKAAFIIAAVLMSARWIVPALLHQIVQTRSRELFITTIILLCLGIALLTSRFGLSLALGAFLAGLVVSESEYAHQATADILPFKESFIGLFFVSVGMLMDVGYLIDHPAKVSAVVMLIFALKVVTGMIAAFSAGAPLRTSIHAGLGLAQIGEFSFVLALAGKSSGLITEDSYQVFLSSSVITMMITPFVLEAAPSLSAVIASRKLLKRADRLRKGPIHEGFPRKRQDHVIIIGFGLNGRTLGRVLRNSGIPYVVLEMNSDTVRKMKARGEPIYYGDGTSREVLQKMGIERARVLVVAISDPVSTRRIVAIARIGNPRLHIIVRTRYLVEVDDLRALGADEVIPEEFETSVEIFSRVLHHFKVPRNVITGHIEDIRKDNYSVLRATELPRKSLAEHHELLENIETETYLVGESSSIAGHSIVELRLRSETGATILAVQRGEDIHQNPPPEFVVRKGDILLMTGTRGDVNRAFEYLESGRFLIEKYQR